MKDLTKLVGLINNSKFRSKGLLNIVLEPDSQMRLLFDAMAEGKISTEEEALALSQKWGLNTARFQSVKSKLKDRLNDAILLLDFDSSSYADRQSAFVECARKWAIAMILISKGARSNAVQLLEVLYRQSRRFEFTEITIDTLRALRLHVSIFSGSHAEFNKYDAELTEVESVWLAEKQVEGLYAKLMINYATVKSDKNAIAEKAAEYWELIKNLLEQHHSYKLHMFGRLIQIAIYENRNDYTTTAGLCEDAIRFFEQKDYKSRSVMQIFYYLLYTCYFNLKRYDRIVEKSAQYLEVFEPGEFNWFKLYELNFHIAIVSGNFPEALNIYNLVTSHAAFTSQPRIIVETWKIFKGYLYLLSLFGHLPNDEKVNKCRMQRLMNDIQTYAKDKSGMNVPVQVLTFLLPFAERNFNQCIDREEAMAKYRSRYLSAQVAPRSHYFFRMLESLPQGGFVLEKVLHRAAPYFKKLQMEPFGKANQSHEIEIIPYETLWELVLEVVRKLEHIPGKPGARVVG